MKSLGVTAQMHALDAVHSNTQSVCFTPEESSFSYIFTFTFGQRMFSHLEFLFKCLIDRQKRDKN